MIHHPPVFSYSAINSQMTWFANNPSMDWNQCLTLTLMLLTLTSGASAASYRSEVLADSPAAYFPLNESGPATADVATNLGTLGPAGNGVHHVGVIHPVAGALAGDADTAATYVAIDSQ